MPDYISAFENDGSLKVAKKAPTYVENLNAQFLQGKVPNDFVQTVASGSTGIYQNNNKLTMTNETVEFTGADSKVKFGNIIIKAAENGILFGIE